MTKQTYTTTRHDTGKTGKQVEVSGSDIISVQQIREAGERIKDVAHRTPVDKSSTFAQKADVESVAFKMENFQRTGAFKIRGAYNKISQLSEEEKDKGVIAASSGNHAQGVALAAKELGVKATIVMPQNTPDSKIEATAGYGADVVLAGEEYEKAYKHARKLEEKQGKTFVHPYNDGDVIAGQGTLGLEMVEQFPELDVVLVAVGGGGLSSGVAAAVKSVKPEARVIGVQTEGCGSAKETLENGELYERDSVDTIAGGIATRKIGELPRKHMEELVDNVVYVSDQEVEAATALLAERQKVVVEPAGAVAAAAVLFQKEHELDLGGENVAVPLCGANVDLEEFGKICQKGKKYLEEVK